MYFGSELCGVFNTYYYQIVVKTFDLWTFRQFKKGDS